MNRMKQKNTQDIQKIWGYLGCHECDNTDDDLDCKTLNREEDLDMSFQSEESRQKWATTLKFLTSLKEIQMYQ